MRQGGYWSGMETNFRRNLVEAGRMLGNDIADLSMTGCHLDIDIDEWLIPCIRLYSEYEDLEQSWCHPGANGSLSDSSYHLYNGTMFRHRDDEGDSDRGDFDAPIAFDAFIDYIRPMMYETFGKDNKDGYQVVPGGIGEFIEFMDEQDNPSGRPDRFAKLVQFPDGTVKRRTKPGILMFPDRMFAKAKKMKERKGKKKEIGK